MQTATRPHPPLTYTPYMPSVRSTAASLTVSVAVSLATLGCGSHGTPPEARQHGQLGSRHFTIMTGHVEEEDDAAAITVSDEGALLVLDEPIADFAPDPANLRVTVAADYQPGGEVVIGAYGAREDLAGAYGIGAQREGHAFSYSFRHGFTRLPRQTGVFKDTPHDPDDTLYFRTEIRTDPPALWAWTPWNQIPPDCTAGPVGDAARPEGDVGDGVYLGLWLRNVTVRGISVLWPTYEGC